jgi:hypothetical protein
MLTGVSEDMLSPTSTLKKDPTRFPETSVNNDLTTRRHISEDGSLQGYHSNLSYMMEVFTDLLNLK